MTDIICHTTGWRKQILIGKHVQACAGPLAESIGTAVALSPTVELLRSCYINPRNATVSVLPNFHNYLQLLM